VDLELADEVAVVTGASRHRAGPLIALLASERTAHVTGANYVIDGGLIKTT
jgi:hypothetical protein